MTYTVDGKDKPVVVKHDLEMQLPSIKKDNLKHADYAKRSIQEIFPQDLINKSEVKLLNYCASMVAINNGSGNFSIQKLPALAQMSCINAVYCTDVNADGYIDLLTGGNQFGFLPQFQRQDCSPGDVLVNNGKGAFVRKDPYETGIQLHGEVRDIQKIVVNKKDAFLILQNNDYPVLFTLKK
jgi:hypothetical protein